MAAINLNGYDLAQELKYWKHNKNCGSLFLEAGRAYDPEGVPWRKAWPHMCSLKSAQRRADGVSQELIPAASVRVLEFPAVDRSQCRQRSIILMHTSGWMGGGMAGWFGGGMWVWTLIGVVVIVLLVVLINRISHR